jgi:heavy metal response regulator
MNILLVEDEPKVAAFIKKGLEEQQYNVTAAYDGHTGQNMASGQDFDVIILDLMLPGINGLELCKTLRDKKKDTPILMLTAMSTVNDKVRGLESGADDYLTKPFHFEELLARIKALTRRKSRAVPGQTLTIDDLEMDCYKRTVTRGGKEVILTVKEFALLELLLQNKNSVLSRTHIAEEVWGINFDRNTNLIDVYINYLRTKIDKDHPKKLVHTVIGMGYVIKD